MRNSLFLLGSLLVAGAVIYALLTKNEKEIEVATPAVEQSQTALTEPAVQNETTQPTLPEPPLESYPEKAISPTAPELSKTPAKKPNDSAEPTLPPLPDTFFLEKDAKLKPVPAPVEEPPVVEEVTPNSLNWFRFAMGPILMSQTQTDAVYSDTRSTTNPLNLNLNLGAKLSSTTGLEFGWCQSLSGNGSSKNLPKSQLSAGFAWQPKTLVTSTSYTRWAVGLSLEDAGYLTGEPGKEKITPYSKMDLYAGMTHNRWLSGSWYLDAKLRLTMSPVRPQEFSSYTDSAVQLDLTPEYEVEKNFRVGVNLGIASKKRSAQLVNYLGQKDTSQIEHQELKTGLSLSFTF